MSSPALVKRGRGRSPGGIPQRTTTVPTNMMTVLSRIKVDVPLHSGRSSRWGRRRTGSTRYSFMSHSSQDSGGSKQPVSSPLRFNTEDRIIHTRLILFTIIKRIKLIICDNRKCNSSLCQICYILMKYEKENVIHNWC